MRKVCVTPRHSQAAVPNFKLNDLLIHALVLHFAHSSMPESVHPAVWDSKLLADRTKHIPVDITDLQWSAELCHEDSTGRPTSPYSWDSLPWPCSRPGSGRSPCRGSRMTSAEVAGGSRNSSGLRLRDTNPPPLREMGRALRFAPRATACRGGEVFGPRHTWSWVSTFSSGASPLGRPRRLAGYPAE